jgi:urea transport system ATP-binding protein
MLTIKGLNQYYGGSHILRDIDLVIPRGACTVVLGRNGAGKSTLLRCLMGALPLARGTVQFDGTDITRWRPQWRARAGIGYVPQGRDIFARLTVEENIAVAAVANGHGAAIDPELYALFPALETMRRRRGGDLSGGQQQQLAIARALAARPRLLILDEPTEGIQPSVIKDIERVLRVLRERGLTLLLVEQYYDFASRLADHYAVLARGQVVKTGLGSDMDTDRVRAHIAV